MNKETTFTSLRELRRFLNELTDAELDAKLNMHDWYVIDIMHSNISGDWFFIEGKDGGEE